MENINIFDVIVLSLTALLGLKGLFRGFIKEFFALFGTVGGVFVASRLASQTGEIVDRIIPLNNNNTMMLVGFVVTIVVFWVLAYLIGIVLSKVFSISGLGIFDKIFGLLFGASKIFLLFSIIIFALSQVNVINKKLNETLKNSIIFPILKDTGSYIIKLDTTKFEKGVTTRVNSTIETAKDTVEKIAEEAIQDKIKDTKKEIENNIKKEIEKQKEIKE